MALAIQPNAALRSLVTLPYVLAYSRLALKQGYYKHSSNASFAPCCTQVQTYAVAAAQLTPAHFNASASPSELQHRASGLTNTDLLGTFAVGGTAAELYGTGTLSQTVSIEMGRQSQSMMGTMASAIGTGPPLSAIAAAVAPGRGTGGPEESPAKKRLTAAGAMLAGLGSKAAAVAGAAAGRGGRPSAEQPAPVGTVLHPSGYDRLSPVSPAAAASSGAAASGLASGSPAAALPALRGLGAMGAVGAAAAAGQLQASGGRSPAPSNPSGGSYAWR